MTRYCGISEFTNGAIYVCLSVITGAMSSTPKASNFAFIVSSGRGVILSIMLQGKETFSITYSENALSTLPLSSQPFIMLITPACNFSPLCEQLSILTTASGAPQDLYRAYSIAATMLIVCFGVFGPFAMSS